MGEVRIEKLSPEAWEAARAWVALIQQAQQEVLRRQAMLELAVTKATGIEFESANWVLDIDHGILELTEEDKPEEPPDDLTPRRKAKRSTTTTPEPAA